MKKKQQQVIKCKCGAQFAACTVLYGGVPIDEDFMTEVAETLNNYGKVEIVNTNETPVSLSECKCKTT